ncbi:MAG TPA: FAD-dependent oxidoreductase [Chitinispirillaceae bacterium]|nr:FAD-dependent oxidoreductase [Chitinispirillaceae bacterium]
MANPIKIQSVVKDITQYGDGVYSVTLLPSKRLPKFKAGQFLHLTVDPYDPQGGWWPESRVFSIASHSSDENVVIVYSVKGKYTKKMRDELSVGKDVWLKLPYGDFTVQSSLAENCDAILVAGGTGVSPYMPFVKKELQNFTNNKVKCIYGVRKTEHILFQDTFEKALTEITNFSLDLFIEQACNNICIKGANQFTGIISIEHIISSSKLLSNPVFFLSGPPMMIKAFKSGLIAKGISVDCIKIDEWE